MEALCLLSCSHVACLHVTLQPRDLSLSTVVDLWASEPLINITLLCKRCSSTRLYIDPALTSFKIRVFFLYLTQKTTFCVLLSWPVPSAGFGTHTDVKKHNN